MIVNIQGGLGNQLFQWAFGRSVGLARNEEVFYDISRCRTQNEYAYSLDAFNINVPTAKGRPRGSERGEPTFRYDPTVYNEPTGLVWNGYWQTERYFNTLVIRKELTFKEPKTERAVELLALAVIKPSCFIHMRRGDYTREPHKSFHGLLPLDYYKEGIARIRAIEPKCVFYAFSDEKEWCKENLPECTILEKTTKFEDLFFMSCCKYAIICNSSFSWWGAWLGDIQEGRTVIAPKKWFQSPSMCYQDVVPDRWVKI
jgi:hypothetical protein